MTRRNRKFGRGWAEGVGWVGGLVGVGGQTVRQSKIKDVMT